MKLKMSPKWYINMIPIEFIPNHNLFKDNCMFIPATFYEQMNEIVKQCYENSKSKGFWTGLENDNVPTKLCLMHSEISEWLEAFRKDNPPCEKPIYIYDGVETYRITSAEEEAADLFIRLCDLCGRLGYDLGRIVLAKMEYNSHRPHMHGGKKV